MTIYSQLSGFKVLVTGANGFIGSRLCARLHEGGIEVHGVSRTKHPSGMLSQWWITDLSDLAAVREIITSIRPDMIFHLASHVSGIRSLELVLPTFTGNLCASVNLLIAATEAGCNKIVMAGSLEEPEMGNTHLVPCSPYAAAKWASSAYARMFHALYQTPVVIARPGMVYGQGQNDNSKLVPYVINSLINGNKPKLSKGT
jgi:UDP-glucose 4-epimerase